MQNLNNLLSLCYKYKEGEFDIEEFQSRVMTAKIPEKLSKEFIETLVDIDNKLEKIIFCSAPEKVEEDG
ncbi:MAG: hypothetical protein II978_07650, partial [Clostridia bacterium]|nr:hypothetical protein [Clostridia bacterium]